SAGVDHVFNETERVALLFLGLLEKMLRKLRQRLGRKMRRDRVILQLGTEFVTNLLVNSVNDFLTGKHNNSLPRITRMQTERSQVYVVASRRSRFEVNIVFGS